MIDSSHAFSGMGRQEQVGPWVEFKVLVADEEERMPARQNPAEVHCRGLPGDGQGARGSRAAAFASGLVIAGSPHL